MTTLLSPSHRVSRSPEVMGAVREDDCNLSIWERPVPAALDALLANDPRDVRFTAPVANLADDLTRELAASGFAKHPALDVLIDDIAQLARRYSAILRESSVEVRLEVVTSNSCRKFHADYVSARLITTYVRTGTQWVDDADADRIANGERPQNVNTLGAGDVGLFKGKLSTEQPAIHRSPPIEGTGERRLLLVLNPPAA